MLQTPRKRGGRDGLRLVVETEVCDGACMAMEIMRKKAKESGER